MFFAKKQFLLACAGFIILFLGTIVFLPRFQKPKTLTSPLPPGKDVVSSSASVPGNAFLPNPQQPIFDNPKIPGDNSAPEKLFPRTANSSTEYRPPSFQDLKDFVVQTAPASTSLFPSPPPQATVALPSVSDAEIAVDPRGATTAMEYVEYFVTHFRDIQFDNQKLESVLKDENRLPFLPIALIEKGIQDDNFSGVRDSLLAYREFIQARISFSKSIKVSAGAIDLDKKTIAFDMLALSLIDKASAPGASPNEEFKSFFAGFKAKAFSENQNLLKTFGILAFLRPSDFFSSFLNRFGLSAAFAQGYEEFGGQIGTPIYCSCAAGFLVSVGPPSPPKSGSLFVPIASISSPLFFPFKSLEVGSWWLGLDFQSSIPCMVYVGKSCVNQGNGSLFFMAGTSI